MGEQGASTGGNNGREEGQAGDIQNVAATTASNQGKFNVTPSFDKDEQSRNQQEAGGHTDGNHKQDGAIDPNSSQDTEQITVSTWIYSLSFRWRKYLIAQIPLLLPSVILMLLGFKAIYNGQKVGESFTATYVPVPYAHVHLTAGESDVLTVQMSSQQFTASITFHVGVVYSLTSDPTPQRHTLRLLSKKFEVVFSNTKNWHAYQLQDGVLVARP